MPVKTPINNVTIYEVDIIPDKVPQVFKSGMSANVDIIYQKKDNILLLPLSAVQYSREGSFVEVKDQGKVFVETGLSDEDNIEILSGVSPQDIILLSKAPFLQTAKNRGTSPFLPSRRRGSSPRRGTSS